MSEPTPVVVHILEKEYRIACPREEQEALIRSARYLDEKMREIRSLGKIMGTDRIAVMAALNIVNELLQQQSESEQTGRDIHERIRNLGNKIENALSRSNA
jgi:cell division protein ZapA